MSPSVYARLAGLIGISVLASGSFANYAASKLIVRNDAAATAGNIVKSELLFRGSIVGGLFMILSWMLYAAVLYKLLKPVNKTHARFMIILVLVSIPIFMLNQLNQFAALPLAADGKHAQMMLFLDLHRHGNAVSSIFFGLWLFPLGLLVFNSGFLPRVLGLLLIAGTPGYLIVFIQMFLFPEAEIGLWANPAIMLTHISELSLMLWLLVRGVNAARWEERALG